MSLNRISYILDNCSYVDERLSVCDAVHTSVFERLVREGLANVDDGLPEAPSNGEFLDLAQRYPEVILGCAIITDEYANTKIYLNSIRATGKLSTQFIIEFATLMRRADDFRLGTKKVHAEFLIREDT